MKAYLRYAIATTSCGLCLVLGLTNCAPSLRDIKKDTTADYRHAEQSNSRGNVVMMATHAPSSKRLPFHAIGSISFKLINRGSSTFRISNNSDKLIHLTSIYPKEANENFSAANVQYAVFRGRKWIYFPDNANTVSYYYELLPRHALAISLDLDYFEAFGVRPGELVKMRVDDIESIPFRL